MIRAMLVDAVLHAHACQMRMALALHCDLMVCPIHVLFFSRFVSRYPYGSEFAFDTTGQEEVVVWLMHFFNASSRHTNTYAAAAKRTVDHVLSYMRSSYGNCDIIWDIFAYYVSPCRPARAVGCILP